MLLRIEHAVLAIMLPNHPVNTTSKGFVAALKGLCIFFKLLSVPNQRIVSTGHNCDTLLLIEVNSASNFENPEVEAYANCYGNKCKYEVNYRKHFYL